jgi:acyl dehydratase
MLYWDQLIGSAPHEYGPLVFSSELLDHLLELMGEKHPVHSSDDFAATTSRRKRIVPGGFIHSITSGWAVRHGSPVAVVGLRSVHWDFISPLYPDTPFYFSNSYRRSEAVDDRLGILVTERRVYDADKHLHAIGRMNVLVLRTSAAPAAKSAAPAAAPLQTA